MKNAGEIVNGVVGILDAVRTLLSAPEGNAGLAGPFEKRDGDKDCMPCNS
jgi:hypothetical protein